MGNQKNKKNKRALSRRQSRIYRRRQNQLPMPADCAAKQVESNDNLESGNALSVSRLESLSSFPRQSGTISEACFSEIDALQGQCSLTNIFRREIHDLDITKAIHRRKLHAFGEDERAKPVSPIDTYSIHMVDRHIKFTRSIETGLHADDSQKVGLAGHKSAFDLPQVLFASELHELEKAKAVNGTGAGIFEPQFRQSSGNIVGIPSNKPVFLDPLDGTWHQESSDVDEAELLVDNATPLDVGRIKQVEVEGRRIVDITFFLKQLHAKFDFHSRGLECHFRHLKLEKYVDHGLRTQLLFRCEMCNYGFDIWTDPDHGSMLGINESAVSGTISCGTGCSTLQEQLAAMNVRPLSHVGYCKYRNNISTDFESLAAEEMAAAAEEEKQMAIKAGRVVNGKPCVAVIADGCWAKRTYGGGKHDSLSGTAMIIGFETKKVLFNGVRNKYCAVHAEAEQLGIEPSVHICYKNWGRDQSSTAMESDIILECFKNSIAMHGLIYKTLISDGDSSTYQLIRDADPYAAHGIVVDKVECSNHLFRNLCKKMRNASAIRLKAAPEKGVVTVTALRKQVHDCGLKIRKNIERARDIRKADNMPEVEKITILQNDISIIFKHVFGQHASCESLPFPCEPKENEKNLIPELERTGIYRDAAESVRYLSCHARSLLKAQTNNIAEACNSIVNKLNYGKRINHCARNSYQIRCAGAVVQHNSQELLSKVHYHIGKRIPFSVARLELSRQHQVLRNKLLRQQKGTRKFRKWQGTDKHYGPSSQQPDVPEEVYKVLVHNHFEKLKEYNASRVEIERDTVAQSDSELWHHLRTSLITASKFGEISRMLKTTSCSRMVQSIRYPKMIDTPAMQFGVANEQAAREALELKLNKKIMPCGLFIDGKIPYLGASPDGLIDEDGVVEIKCPFSAKDEDPEDAIKRNARLRSIFDRKNVDCMSKTHLYYYQVQGQLHITGRKYCIFALWTSVDIKYVKVAKDDAFWRTIQPLLSRFYMQCLLPEILDSRRNRSMPLREPTYILQAREDACLKKKKSLVKKFKRELKIKQLPRKRCKIKDSVLLINNELLQDKPETMNPTTGDIHERIDHNRDWVRISSDEEVDIDITDSDMEALEAVRQNIDVDQVIVNISLKTSLLTDTSVDLFQQILHETVNFGFNPASYTGYFRFIQPCQSVRDMQIVDGNKSEHWYCILYDGSHVLIYDSLCPCDYRLIHKEVRRYIQRRYPSVKIENIVVQPVSKQPDTFSCGVYAAPFATTIALGGDPVTQKYSEDASSMRAHMITIIRSRRLSPFPLNSP